MNVQIYALVLLGLLVGTNAWQVRCPDASTVDHDEAIIIPNRRDCSSFYMCSNDIPWLMQCPDGLHFNEKLRVCDWPARAGCSVPSRPTTTTRRPIRPTTTTRRPIRPTTTTRRPTRPTTTTTTTQAPTTTTRRPWWANIPWWPRDAQSV